MYIQLKQIKKTYTEGEKQHLILSDVNLSIAKGEFVVLLGASGSGKTTLLNLISAIDTPDNGDIIIDKQSINVLDEHQKTLFRRESIGFIFQFFNLIPTLTVAENLQFPLELNGKLNHQTQAELEFLLNKLGIRDKQNSYPEQLSGGEQQRVAIARTLIHRPKLLLADEPTGNLDDSTGEQVMDLLQELAKLYDMTMLVVTHSMAVAERADRVLQLKQGRIIQG
jgi:putative ABC transport system ATP-binding protein